MLQTLLNHKSIRKYKDKAIDDNTLNKILEAGTKASTTGNMQVYSIIVTKDEEIKNQLWESHFKQDMVKQAPVILTFCADFNRFNKWCKLRKADAGYDNFLSFYTASIDALLVAQNVAVAAEEFELGICYLGTTTYMADKIKGILNLPESVVSITTLVLGYPDEKPELTDRLPMHGIIHHEKYNDYTDEQINEIYTEKEALKSTKELISINEKENLAQVFTDNRYKKEDNILFSNLFLEHIKNQGFMNNK